MTPRHSREIINSLTLSNFVSFTIIRRSDRVHNELIEKRRSAKGHKYVLLDIEFVHVSKQTRFSSFGRASRRRKNQISFVLPMGTVRVVFSSRHILHTALDVENVGRRKDTHDHERDTWILYGHCHGQARETKQIGW